MFPIKQFAQPHNLYNRWPHYGIEIDKIQKRKEVDQRRININPFGIFAKKQDSLIKRIQTQKPKLLNYPLENRFKTIKKSQFIESNQSQQFKQTINHHKQKKSSMQSRWNRHSQIGTRSGIKRQYQRFFDDSQNVFHQQTTLMKQSAVIDFCWYRVICLFFFSFLFWLVISSIKPYQKPCPRHATCGAYVKCDQSYVFNRELNFCQIDPKVIDSAIAIMQSVIREMKYEYGQKECTIPINMSQSQVKEYLKPPKKALNQIFKQMDIMDSDFDVLRSELTKNFNEKSKQAIGKFKKDELSRFYPQQKLYTITCKLDIIYRNNFKTILFLCAVIAVMLIFVMINLSKSLYKKKAKKIYDFLKLKTIENRQIIFEDYRLEVQQKFNRNREISEDLWLSINDFRIEQKIIGSYEVNSSSGIRVVWRSLSSV